MDFVQRTIDLAHRNVEEGGRPFATRESYAPHYVDDRKYFELDTFYAEFAKPWHERRLPMRFDERDAAVEVYRRWQERNGGQRNVVQEPLS